MQDFFHYFPVSPRMREWGVCATSFGQVRVRPNTTYPPARHPEGHHFNWEQGRTLQNYQLLYIQEGQGSFESAVTKTRRIGPGTVFLLFPGIWHRYRPRLATGWTEYWIELGGFYMDQLRTAGIIDPKNPVYRMNLVDEIESLLGMAQHLGRSKPPEFSVRLGLLSVQILTLLRAGSGRRHAKPRRLENLISKAQVLLARNLAAGFSVEEIARQLGISYSYFRREFKRQTGFSPRQYLIQIRHRRTKDLLHDSSLTIKEISERLGYDSPYHLSLDFAKRSGQSPGRWRREGRVTPPGRISPG